MDYNSFWDSLRKFGGSIEDICLNTLGIDLNKINETVIVSPGWFPERLFATGEIQEIVQVSPLFQYKIWNIKQNDFELTYIKTGFGAPVVMDCILLLGLTGTCKKIIFVSSVGGLSDELNIGDIVLPEYSVCGDGASRYLSDDFQNYSFGEKQYPHKKLFNRLIGSTQDICNKHNVRWHLGRTFCIDTIAAQHNHLNQIINMGHNSIDMESAAAFKAANMLNIPIVAILNVSDNSVEENKSLMSKRNQEERKYRRYVAREIVPQIIMDLMRTYI